MENKKIFSKFALHLIFILISFSFIIPMMYVVSVSLSSEQAISQFGYQLFPQEVSLNAYKYIFNNTKQLIDSYKVTSITSIFGSFASVLIMALIAYPLSRQDFYFKKPITFFVFFTMLFGGGLIPNYILNTQYLGLGNNIWIYILPSLANAWYIIIMRTFFQQLPQSLVESAKIDGAKEFKIFFNIILPLSKPVIATILLMTLLTKWNDWYTTLIYIRDSRLYTLQYMLQRILREVEFIKAVTTNLGSKLNISLDKNVPTEPIRFAMVIVAAGPMLIIFPFFQKYFTKGLTIGAVKG